MIAAGLGAGVLLTEGIDTQLIGLPLIKQADNMEVWFADRAEFGQEDQRTDVPFRTARWSSQRPGDCTIKDSEITVRRDGRVQFAAKVKSRTMGTATASLSTSLTKTGQTVALLKNLYSI
jgi:hypothetical protein